MAKRKPIVWIVKEQVKRDNVGGISPMDYTPAMKWGELRFITSFDPPPMVTRSSLLEAWKKAVDAFIDEFDASTDFVIASGQPTAMIMIGYLLGEANMDSDGLFIQNAPRFLLWRREEGAYIPYDPLNAINNRRIAA